MAHRSRASVRMAGAVAALLVASCGGGPKLYPVRGKVLYLDHPAEGATVLLQPLTGGPDAPMSFGTVQADGTFTLRTHPHGEGAPAGEYIVLVTWLSAARGSLEDAQNRLPPRYSSPTDSPLRAKVNPGTNELEPFRLTK